MSTFTNTLRGLLMVASIALLTQGCQKYEEGGAIRKAEDNLTSNTWKLDQYYRNGNDETSLLLISDFTEEFASDGSLTRAYIDPDNEDFSETGAWNFDNDKLQINLTGVGSVELTDETTTVSSSDYNITKLDKEELWYKYENGGDEHEFHFVPN